jgi:hypothetical protein
MLVLMPSHAAMQAPSVLTPPNGMVVEVKVGAEWPTSQIPLSPNEPYGFWTSNVERIKGWKVGVGGSAGQAVNFQARRVGEKAEITVSVFRGSRFREFEDVAATYLLGEGESVVVSEVAKFGFVPPTIRAVTVRPVVPDAPVVLNRSQLLHVEVIPYAATIPSFTAKISNRSERAVVGLGWSTVRDGRILQAASQRDTNGRPLILPGETLERDVRLIGIAAWEHPGAFSIDSVVFDDGSFEGRVESAAQTRVLWYSDKATLTRLVPILKAAGAAAPARPDAGELIRAIEAGARTVPSAAADVIAEFPQHPNLHKTLKSSFPKSSSTVTNEMIGILRNLEKAAVGRSDADVNAALAKVVLHFQDWLDRLSK